MWASQLGLVSGDQVHRGLWAVAAAVVGRGLAAITSSHHHASGRGWRASRVDGGHDLKAVKK